MSTQWDDRTKNRWDRWLQDRLAGLVFWETCYILDITFMFYTSMLAHRFIWEFVEGKVCGKQPHPWWILVKQPTAGVVCKVWQVGENVKKDQVIATIETDEAWRSPGFRSRYFLGKIWLTKYQTAWWVDILSFHPVGHHLQLSFFIFFWPIHPKIPLWTGHSGREGTTRWSVVRDQTAGGGRSPVLGLIKCVSWCWKKGRSQKLQYHNWGMMNIHLAAILVFTRSHHILIYNYSWWLSAFLLVRLFWARYTTFSAGFNILRQSVLYDLICIEYGVYIIVIIIDKNVTI